MAGFSSRREPVFTSEEDLVNASELREYIYCARSWLLTQQGYEVSRAVRARREAGIKFHEARAARQAQQTNSRATMLWLIFTLIMIGTALLLVKALLESGGH